MKKSFVFVLLLSLLVTANAQDAKVEKPAKIIFVPTVGDRLIFDYTRKDGEDVVVAATIANIHTGVNAVTAQVTLTPKGKPTIKRTIEWFSTPMFIESNFLGVSTRREWLQIGDFKVETVRVDGGNTSFWFSVNADGSSRYPELIKAVRNNKVLVNLRSIVRKKAEKKSK